MDINLELTDDGLEVHVTMGFDPKFEERGRVTTTLLREKLREHGVNALNCIKSTMINFRNQSDTWVFEVEEEILEQLKASSLKCKNSRSKVKKTSTPAPEKALQEEKASVPSKRKTRKKSVPEA